MEKLEVEKQVVNNPHNVVDELLDQISNNKDLSDDVVIKMIKE